MSSSDRARETASIDLNMRVARPGATDNGVEVPVGTIVEYRGHVPLGMVRVRFEDGTEGVMHPACFDELA